MEVSGLDRLLSLARDLNVSANQRPERASKQASSSSPPTRASTEATEGVRISLSAEATLGRDTRVDAPDSHNPNLGLESASRVNPAPNSSTEPTRQAVSNPQRAGAAAAYARVAAAPLGERISIRA